MNPIVIPETTWDQAVFLIDQGKSYYNCWSSTWSNMEAGFREFTAALEVLDKLEASDPEHQKLKLEALEWQGHAFMKSLKFDEALESYWKVVLMQEQMSGRYSQSTELAYQWLSKAYQAKGMAKEAIHALFTAARIEHVQGGPSGPHQSFLKWKELWLKGGNSNDMLETLWKPQLYSIQLEVEGDDAFRKGNMDLAFEAYQEALKLEKLYWGLPSTPRHAWLNRKAALVWYDDPYMDLNRLLPVESIQSNCPVKKYPIYCEHLVRGEEFYRDHELSLASEAFVRALEGKVSSSPTVSLPGDMSSLVETPFIWIFTLLFAFLLSFSILGSGRYRVVEKCKGAWTSLSDTLLGLWRRIASFLKRGTRNSKLNGANMVKPESTEESQLFLGRTIVDAVSDDEDDDGHSKTQTADSPLIASDDISAGVRSIGQYLFESDMGDGVVLSNSGHDHSQLQPIGE